MVAAGFASGDIITDSVEMKYFRDPNAGTVSHGTLSPAGSYPYKGVSNGTIAMFGGNDYLSIKPSPQTLSRLIF